MIIRGHDTGFSNHKSFSFLVLLVLLSSTILYSVTNAEAVGPGWFKGEANPVSRAAANAYLQSKQQSAQASSALIEGAQALC